MPRCFPKLHKRRYHPPPNPIAPGLPAQHPQIHRPRHRVQVPVRARADPHLRARRAHRDIPRDFGFELLRLLAGLLQRDVDGARARAQFAVFDCEHGGAGTGAAEEGELD